MVFDILDGLFCTRLQNKGAATERPPVHPFHRRHFGQLQSPTAPQALSLVFEEIPGLCVAFSTEKTLTDTDWVVAGIMDICHMGQSDCVKPSSEVSEVLAALPRRMRGSSKKMAPSRCVQNWVAKSEREGKNMEFRE